MNKRTLLVSLLVFAISGFSALVHAQTEEGNVLRTSAQQNAVSDQEAAYLQMLRQNQVSGNIDPQDVDVARKDAASMRKSKNASALNLNFTYAGPDNIGGRTRGLVIDIDAPTTIYAGSAGGGVWKSQSNGTSWVQMAVNGGLTEAIQVACLLQTPAGTLYAGTGESWYTPDGTIGRGGFYGTGLYKSTDRSNFTRINGTENWKFINELAFYQGRLWVATEQGLFYSNDEQNWTLAKDNSGNNLSAAATDVKVGSNGILVAVVDKKTYVSENGAADGFVNQSTAAAGKLPASSLGRTECAVAPSNPDVIYVSIASTIGNVLGIYRSVDKGATWSIIAPGASTSFSLFSYPRGTTQTFEGLYNNTIAVWPTDPDIILVGGVDIWQGGKVAMEGYFGWSKATSHQFDPLSGLGALYVHKGINQIVFHPTLQNTAFIATDGGVFQLSSNLGFQPRHKNYNTNHFYTVSAAADGAIMGGTADNGVIQITGKGNTPEEGDVIFEGEGGTSLFSIIDYKVFIISRAGAPLTVRRTTTYGADYVAAFGDNIGMTTITSAFIPPMLLWESFYDYTSRDSVWFVADTNYLPGDNIFMRSHNFEYPFTATAPYALTKGDSLLVQDPVVSRFFFGGVNGVWMTDMILDFRGLPRWARIATFVSTVQSMGISKDGNYLFVGTQNGTLLRFSGVSSYQSEESYDITMDTIASWPGRVITSIAVSPSNNARVMVTLGNYGNTNYVYGTNNATDPSPVFTSWQGNLPAMPVYSSLIEMIDQNRLMLGTEHGLFSATYTGGAPVWTAETNGIPAAPIFQINQQNISQHTIHTMEIQGLDTLWTIFPGTTNYGVIYVATHGRGLYSCKTFVGTDDIPVIQRASASDISIYPNPATQQTALQFDLLESAQTTYNIYDINGRCLRSVKLGNLQAGTYNVQIDLNGLKKGMYILTLQDASTKARSAKLLVN